MRLAQQLDFGATTMLPARLIRRRIAIQLDDHIEWLAGLYAERGFAFGEVTKEPPDAAPERVLAWRSRDFEVRYEPLSDEGRPQEMHVTWRNLPSPVARTKDEPRLGWEHRFALVLPPRYPSSMQMRLVNLTPTLHPRMLPPDREAPACIFPNADLDSTLREMFWNLLFRPDMVRPPELYDAEDSGFRPSEMQWYSRYGPQRLYDELLTAWHQRQGTFVTADPEPAEPEPPAPAPPASPFRIVDEEDAEPQPPPPFRVVDSDE